MPLLKDRSILVSIHIGSWNPWKRSKEVRDSAAQMTKAEIAQLTGGIRLLNSPELNLVKAFDAAFRKEFLRQTSPWLDSGIRICPTSKVNDPSKPAASVLIKMLQEGKIERSKLLKAFFAKYPLRKEEAKPLLKTLFREEYYPTVENLESRFYFTYSSSALPDVTDFRIQGLSTDEMNEVRKEVQETERQAMQKIEMDLFERIQEVMTTTISSLGGSRFKVNTLNNVAKLVENVRGLNLTGSAKIETLCKTLSEIASKDPNLLRENQKLFEETMENCREIVDTCEGELDGAF